MIVCGFCGQDTSPGICPNCQHDAVLPYVQRGQVPAPAGPDRRLDAALRVLGRDATVEQIAEHLDISPRTVRRWREKSGS